ncbi:MAG: hypothetical protein R3F62_23785 [Planctomycetota bacterium]
MTRRTLRLLAAPALALGLGLAPAVGQDQDPPPEAQPDPAEGEVQPPPADPFRADRRRAGSAALSRLPAIAIKALIQLQGRKPLALLEVAGATQVVREGEVLSVAGSGNGPRIALAVEAIGPQGVRLVHRESGEGIELR